MRLNFGGGAGVSVAILKKSAQYMLRLLLQWIAAVAALLRNDNKSLGFYTSQTTIISIENIV